MGKWRDRAIRSAEYPSPRDVSLSIKMRFVDECARGDELSDQRKPTGLAESRGNSFTLRRCVTIADVLEVATLRRNSTRDLRWREYIRSDNGCPFSRESTLATSETADSEKLEYRLRSTAAGHLKLKEGGCSQSDPHLSPRMLGAFGQILQTILRSFACSSGTKTEND